jgi:hypothetical protein
LFAGELHPCHSKERLSQIKPDLSTVAWDTKLWPARANGILSLFKGFTAKDKNDYKVVITRRGNGVTLTAVKNAEGYRDNDKMIKEEIGFIFDGVDFKNVATLRGVAIQAGQFINLLKQASKSKTGGLLSCSIPQPISGRCGITSGVECLTFQNEQDDYHLIMGCNWVSGYGVASPLPDQNPTKDG